MAGVRFPNESAEYRARRDEMLELETALRGQTEAVARQRRELPLGGRLLKDYRFEQLGAEGPVREVPFEDLFGERDSLLIYTKMFGSNWDAPCPSCTSLVDAFNAHHYPVSQHGACRRCSSSLLAVPRRGWTGRWWGRAEASCRIEEEDEPHQDHVGDNDQDGR
jgi:predicted dithiol-disulfide oxidoreductase (DUF899 family)